MSNPLLGSPAQPRSTSPSSPSALDRSGGEQEHGMPSVRIMHSDLNVETPELENEREGGDVEIVKGEYKVSELKKIAQGIQSPYNVNANNVNNLSSPGNMNNSMHNTPSVVTPNVPVANALTFAYSGSPSEDYNHNGNEQAYVPSYKKRTSELVTGSQASLRGPSNNQFVYNDQQLKEARKEGKKLRADKE